VLLHERKPAEPPGSARHVDAAQSLALPIAPAIAQQLDEARRLQRSKPEVREKYRR